MDNTVIIAHLPGGIEVRTAHGADGKFTSGGGTSGRTKHKYGHFEPGHGSMGLKPGPEHARTKEAQIHTDRAYKTGQAADHAHAAIVHTKAAEAYHAEGDHARRNYHRGMAQQHREYAKHGGHAV